MSLSAADGRQPLLNWLREKQRLCATKEGCGSGDCGACTVLVGRLQEQHIYYQSVNACIALLGGFSGCHVVTLEGLSLQTMSLPGQENDSTTTATPLHPVQQALVDYDGSQCGFCTPGIVMAMVAWWLNTPANPLQTEAQKTQHRHVFSAALSGNLCRCTGYQPIFNAADHLAPGCLAGNLDAIAVAGLSQKEIKQQLSAYSQSALHRHAKTTENYWLPVSDAQWLQTLAAVPLSTTDTQEDIQFVAGSTDLGVAITQQQSVPATLINVTQLAGFKDIYIDNNQLHIGAGVTFSELETFLSQPSFQPDSQSLPPTSAQFSSMQQAWLKLLPLIGSRQVRNEGTIGGNIANASPIADTPPLLLALEARLVLQYGTQTRTLPLSEFYLGYKQTQLQKGELIKTIIIDLPSPLTKVYVEKISKRKEDDISAVCLAMAMHCDDQHKHLVKIGLGGVAATPVYAHALADYMGTHACYEITEQQLLSLLAQDISPLSDARASADYRLHTCAKVLHYWLQQGTTAPASAAKGGVL